MATLKFLWCFADCTETMQEQFHLFLLKVYKVEERGTAIIQKAKEVN